MRSLHPISLPFLALSLLMSLSSCLLYKAVPISAEEDLSWEHALASSVTHQPTPITFIQDGQYYHMTAYTTDGRILRGTLQQGADYVLPDKRRLPGNKIPARSRTAFQQTLFVRTAVPLEEGPVVVPIEAGYFTRYRPATGLSIVASIGMVYAAIAVAGIFLSSFSG